MVHLNISIYDADGNSLHGNHEIDKKLFRKLDIGAWFYINCNTKILGARFDNVSIPNIQRKERIVVVAKYDVHGDLLDIFIEFINYLNITSKKIGLVLSEKLVDYKEEVDNQYLDGVLFPDNENLLKLKFSYDVYPTMRERFKALSIANSIFHHVNSVPCELKLVFFFSEKRLEDFGVWICSNGNKLQPLPTSHTVPIGNIFENENENEFHSAERTFDEQLFEKYMENEMHDKVREILKYKNVSTYIKCLFEMEEIYKIAELLNIYIDDNIVRCWNKNNELEIIKSMVESNYDKLNRFLVHSGKYAISLILNTKKKTRLY